MNAKKRSIKARNRWQKAITLMNNPVILVEYHQKRRSKSKHVALEVGVTGEILDLQDRY